MEPPSKPEQADQRDPIRPPEATQPREPVSPSGDPSSTGLDANVAGLLCYLLGFVSGIAFLVLEKRSSFVRFHALQSTFTFVGLLALQYVAGWIPLLGTFLAFLVSPVSIVLWVLLMVRAYQGERFKLPVMGDLADEHSEIP